MKTKIVVKQKDEKLKIIELKYKIQSAEQAAYEAVMAGSAFRKVFFFSLITPEINWEVINFITRKWEDKEIWKKAIRFVEKIGKENISSYNAGTFPAHLISQGCKGGIKT
jgi:hypothetical protein